MKPYTRRLAELDIDGSGIRKLRSLSPREHDQKRDFSEESKFTHTLQGNDERVIPGRQPQCTLSDLALDAKSTSHHRRKNLLQPYVGDSKVASANNFF